MRKERGVFITIPEFELSLDTAQLEATEQWFALYGETQIIHDAIRKFRVQQQFTTLSDGIVTFPTDYLHLIGGGYTVNGSTVNTIRFLNEDEIKTCAEIIKNNPEYIYGPKDEPSQTMLDEIQAQTIIFVGKKLIDLGFDVKNTFKEYIE